MQGNLSTLEVLLPRVESAPPQTFHSAVDGLSISMVDGSVDYTICTCTYYRVQLEVTSVDSLRVGMGWGHDGRGMKSDKW